MLPIKPNKRGGIFIPTHIWSHPSLSILDKLVWAIIETNGRGNFNIEDTANFLKTTPENILLSVETIFKHRLLKGERYV